MEKALTSRTEYWKEYRERIINKSVSIDNAFDSKLLSKIIKDVRSINPNIEKELKVKLLKIPQVIKIDSLKEYYFDSIIFNSSHFSVSTIKEIDDELSLSSNLNYNYIVDENNLVSLSSFDNSDSLDKLLVIKNGIENVKKDIQLFPKESKSYLNRLTSLIKSAASNKEQKLNDFVLIENDKKSRSRKNLLFFILLSTILLLFVVTLVIVLLIVFI